MSRALRGAEDIDGLLAQVARPLGGHEDHRGGAVVLLAAVVEVERLDDPARGVVGLFAERPSVHHRSRVVLCVLVAGEGDGAQRFLLHAVLVHEAPHAHRVLLRGREHAVGLRERVRTLGAGAASRLAEAAVLPLRERAVDDDDISEAGVDRRRAVGDGARSAAPAAAPDEVAEPVLRQPQRGGDTVRQAAFGGVGGEAVDLGDLDAGVGGGADDRIEAHLELGVLGAALPVVGGLGDACDGDLAADRALVGCGHCGLRSCIGGGRAYV